MPKVSLVAPDALAGADVVVIGVRPGPELLPSATPVDLALGGRLGQALRDAGATGEPDDVVRIPTLGEAPFPLVIASGLGDTPSLAAGEAVRRAAGAALRAVPSGRRRVHLALGDDVGAIIEGALLGSYRFTAYKSGPSAPEVQLTVGVSDPRQGRDQLRRARRVAAAGGVTRDLVNTPPNDLYPASFADRIAQRAKAADLDVEVLDDGQLRKGGYGGLLGVGGGSARPPRLVRIGYSPRRARGRLALIGKGITFDSGGLNLKPGSGMATMKCDMAGAAAVATAVMALAELRVPVEVVATVPMAENMPSGSAYRPSDVLTLRDGTTVEVTNTDAEGRLVLADGIARALEDEPDHLVEISTLTGGQVVALGPRVIGVMGEPQFRDEVVAAGQAAGESSWGMPLPDDLRAGLDSSVAELVNSPSERWGSMLVGGLFLDRFVPDGLPWVHLDIAGPAYHEGTPYGYTAKGGTGAGVRTLVAVAERLATGSA